MHDPKLKTNCGNTVEDLLIANNLNVPKEWQTNSDRVLTDNDK